VHNGKLKCNDFLVTITYLRVFSRNISCWSRRPPLLRADDYRSRWPLKLFEPIQWNVEFSTIVFNISYIVKCRTQYNNVKWLVVEVKNLIKAMWVVGTAFYTEQKVELYIRRRYYLRRIIIVYHAISICMTLFMRKYLCRYSRNNTIYTYLTMGRRYWPWCLWWQLIFRFLYNSRASAAVYRVINLSGYTKYFE